MKYVHSPSDIPDEAHIAALVFGSIHIPGDERSRTHPGHGYPASTETKIDYIVFESQVEATKWVSEREARKYGNDAYRIITASGRKVTKKVEISL